MLKRASAIIVSSPPYLESSLPLQGFRHRCHIVPLGLNLDTWPNAKEESEPEKDSPVLRVLAVGRPTYYKGFEYLIRAVAMAPDIELHIVGAGKEEASLKALALVLELGQRITFHGYLPESELAHQYRACDCVCLPSYERTEAFGLVLLEAMYHSRPTVISNVPGSGMGWIVEDNYTGLHVSPSDAGALANALQYLQNHRELIVDFGHNGRLKFDRLFNIDESAKSVRSIYDLVLGVHSESQSTPELVEGVLPRKL